MIQKPKPTQIDWLKAVILERMNDADASMEDLATLCKMSRATLGTLMKTPTSEWRFEYRKAILKELKIRIADLPEDVQIKIAQACA